VKGGGAMTYSEDDSRLYAFRGNNTREFWSYGPVSGYGYLFAAGNEAKEVQTTGNAKVMAAGLSIAPNPFTNATAITYSLPKPGNVSLRLYDVSGKLVTTLASGYTAAGSHAALINAEKLARGIYLVTFETDSYNTTEKLIIE
jgi:hypothetical protein